MATLTWPAGIVPQTVAWHLEANTAAFTSPLTGAVQTVELPGARWVAEFTLPGLPSSGWRAWSAFVARLRGMAGRVYVPPFHARTGSTCARSGTTTAPTCDDATVTCDSTAYTVDAMTFSSLGTPRVDGASQSGNTLSTDGWEPAANIFNVGDFFHYATSAGQTLHMVTADVRADGSGAAALPVEPPIRTAPADNATIEIDAPTCIMRLADAASGAPSYQPGVFAGVAVSLREAF